MGRWRKLLYNVLYNLYGTFLQILERKIKKMKYMVEGEVNENVLTGGQPERERLPGKHVRSLKRVRMLNFD